MRRSVAHRRPLVKYRLDGARPNVLRISCRRRHAAQDSLKIAPISRAEGGQLHARVGRADSFQGNFPYPIGHHTMTLQQDGHVRRLFACDWASHDDVAARWAWTMRFHVRLSMI